jgi:hypothetical protein
VLFDFSGNGDLPANDMLKALNLDDEQKRETLNNLLGRCLITPEEKDMLQHPFSWRAFRHGEICSDPPGE